MLKHDRLVGIGILIIGALLFRETLAFPVHDWEPLGMAFWPRLLLILLGLFAIFFIARGAVDRQPAEPLRGRPFIVAALAFAYVLSLRPIGFLIVTPIFIFVFALLLTERIGPMRIAEAAIVAGAGTGAVYLVFETGLRFPLPPGLLD